MTITGERWAQPARSRTLRLGEYRLSYVYDGAIQLHPTRFLAGPAEGEVDGKLLDEQGYLVCTVGGLLIQHGDRAMLVDAGQGLHAQTARDQDIEQLGYFHGGGFLGSLAALGVAAGDIELVAVTHLHSDHIGWIEHLPNARVALAKREADSDPDRVAPFVHRTTYVADGEEIFPGVRAWHTMGHTPGHTSYILQNGTHRLIAFGDAMHSSAQVGRPEWSSFAEHDGEASTDNRKKIIAELERPGTIGFGVHFADVPFGRVVRGQWEPVDQL
ncbi:MBL fold metallo-hydrolase [Pseudonocardiaceae bacterium YIM PH 21723]|nr:MBL fold metallo-hydrolase [Pseudonocardiaceae bacterium YIM PH 21723]